MGYTNHGTVDPHLLPLRSQRAMPCERCDDSTVQATMKIIQALRAFKFNAQMLVREKIICKEGPCASSLLAGQGLKSAHPDVNVLYV